MLECPLEPFSPPSLSPTKFVAVSPAGDTPFVVFQPLSSFAAYFFSHVTCSSVRWNRSRITHHKSALRMPNISFAVRPSGQTALVDEKWHVVGIVLLARIFVTSSNLARSTRE
jgi:hypothetical protein